MNKIRQWVNTCIALFALVISGSLGFIANREHLSSWRGIKNLSGFIYFQKDDPFYGKSGFIISIKNNGLTPQDIAFIQNDKKEQIDLFIDTENNLELTLKPGGTTGLFLIITPDVLRKLKNADSLILFNNMGKTKKIISKKEIQKALESYKKL